MERAIEREREIVLRWRVRGQAEALAPSLARAYPVETSSSFDQALKAIDEAERQAWDAGDPSADPPE